MLAHVDLPVGIIIGIVLEIYEHCKYYIILHFRAQSIQAKMRCKPRGGVLPYIGYIGMCCCEGYGFQAVYSGIGYIDQGVWVY